MARLSVILLPTIPVRGRPAAEMPQRASAMHNMLRPRLPGLSQGESAVQLLLLRNPLPLPELQETGRKRRDVPATARGKGASGAEMEARYGAAGGYSGGQVCQ